MKGKEPPDMKEENEVYTKVINSPAHVPMIFFISLYPNSEFLLNHSSETSVVSIYPLKN